MILVRKTCKNRNHLKGFTLLEIIMTMLIVTIIVGSGFMLLTKQPTDPLDEIEIGMTNFILKAHEEAEESGQAIYVEVRQQGLSLNSVNLLDSEESTERVEGQLSYDLPTGAKLFYRENNQVGWKPFSRSSELVVWCVARTGIADDINLRVEMEGGYTEMSFDPLSGDLIR